MATIPLPVASPPASLSATPPAGKRHYRQLAALALTMLLHGAALLAALAQWETTAPITPPQPLPITVSLRSPAITPVAAPGPPAIAPVLPAAPSIVKPPRPAKPVPAPKQSPPPREAPARPVAAQTPTPVMPARSSTTPAAETAPEQPPAATATVAAASPPAPSPAPAPAAPAVSAAPVETGVSISATYAASNRRPVQPAVSRRFGEEGTVRLNVLVRADGRAGTVEVKTSSGFPLLDETARSAVESWRFNPATLDGKPVQKWYIVPIVFKLEN